MNCTADCIKMIVCKKHVRMTRKYHNHTLQTRLGHLKEEQQSTDCHNAPGRQPKQSKATSSPLPTQNDIKYRKNKTRTNHKTLKNNGTNSKQQIDNNRTTALERTAVVQIHPIGTESSPQSMLLPKHNKMSSSHEGPQHVQTHHYRENTQ